MLKAKSKELEFGGNWWNGRNNSLAKRTGSCRTGLLCSAQVTPNYHSGSHPAPTVPFQYWINRTAILVSSNSLILNYTENIHKPQLATLDIHSHSIATFTPYL